MEVSFNPTVSSKSGTSSSRLLTRDEILYNDFTNIKNRINFHGYSELCNFVKANILDLLTSAVDKKAKPLQIITDKDFLIAMDMSNIVLDREYTNRFNRVYRSYVINPTRNVIYNQTSADMLYKVALKLNKKLVTILTETGLKESDAVWLVVNRYSSTDERRNIRRMVRTMQHIDPFTMTEQMVVDIFSKTFSDQFTNLFIAVMTDRFDAFDSDDEKYVYSTVSNALLDILNTMDPYDVQDIIMEYEDELRKSGVSGRFSLKSINSGDYGLICSIVDELEFRGYPVD